MWTSQTNLKHQHTASLKKPCDYLLHSELATSHNRLLTVKAASPSTHKKNNYDFLLPERPKKQQANKDSSMQADLGRGRAAQQADSSQIPAPFAFPLVAAKHHFLGAEMHMIFQAPRAPHPLLLLVRALRCPAGSFVTSH
jgi:hypothetical protein